MTGKGFANRRIHATRFREQHYTRRITIQSMMNTEIRRASVTFIQEPRHGCEQAVATRIQSRMRRQAGWFIDDDKIRVFEQNAIRCHVEFTVARCRIPEELRRIEMRFDSGPECQCDRWNPDAFPIQINGARHDQLSRFRFRYRTPQRLAQPIRQNVVQPLLCVISRGHEFEFSNGHKVV